MHTMFVGVGSNLGDRQANILQALQKLRAFGTIEAVSSYYDTPPAAGAAGPAFLNIAAKLETNLEPEAFERAARSVEIAVGRQRAQHSRRGRSTSTFSMSTISSAILAASPYRIRT